uniref:HIT-type domain-containing protein n=1 Tax=Anopheles melas TaxID=34690 RepID=A0A182TUZ3_9DIPT
MQLQRRFCLLLVGAACLVLLVSLHVDVVQTASIYAPDFNDSSAHFLDQQRSCRDLCSFCPTCNGFYCGEECICECSQDPTEHAKCIDKIKANSEQLGLEYDLFIQPPQKRSTRTRFGRRVKTTPAETNDSGKLSGFHKILFSNFATAKKVTVPEQPQQEVIGSTVMEVESIDTAVQEERNSKDPLEKSEVVELLFN